MRLIVILTTLLFMTSCSQNEIAFTDIKTTKSDSLTRIRGSKVLIHFSPDYQHVEGISRFQKREDLFFLVAESNQSFPKVKENLRQDFAKQNGADVEIWNEIEVNNYDGVYLEGPAASPGMRAMYVGFGNSDFVVMLMGVFRASDEEGQTELKNTFRTIYYDSNVELDPLELATFEFDKSITQFKHAVTVSSFFTFNRSGTPNSKTNTEPYIQVASLPKLTAEKAEGFIREYLRGVENSGTKVDSKEIKSVTINGYPAYEVDTSIIIEGEDGVFYQAILLGSNSSVLFLGMSRQDLPKYKDEFARTAKTIRIK